MMKVKFWGVRGSIPCPGRKTVKYGGNTSCLEVVIEDARREIIVDAGSGIRELGIDLLNRNPSRSSIQADLLITHTHLDHILGLPFFAPIYLKKTRLRIMGPLTYEDESLESAVTGQFSYRYFPVRLSELASEMEFVALKEESLDLGDGIGLSTKYLNHPVSCLGYRLEYGNKVCCTVFDTEPFQNLFCTDPGDPSFDEAMALEGGEAAREANQRVEEFLAGADLLIYDAQYTRGEYAASRVGWGHTAIEEAYAVAGRNGVKRLALFHHDPLRTDGEIDALAEKLAAGAGPDMPEVFFAREGMEVEL